jgi:uncharacterized protein
MIEKPKVLHSSVEKKFYIIIDGKECKVEYDLVKDDKGNTVLEIYNTFVPEVLRGQGIAKEIYLGIIKYLDENTMKVRPTCSYAVEFFGIEKYQKYVE